MYPAENQLDPLMRRLTKPDRKVEQKKHVSSGLRQQYSWENLMVGRKMIVRERRTQMSIRSLVSEALRSLCQWVTKRRKLAERGHWDTATSFPWAVHCLCVLRDHNVDGSEMALLKGPGQADFCRLSPHPHYTRDPSEERTEDKSRRGCALY